MRNRRFSQVDVFSADPYGGNPLAVVHDAEDLDTESMQRFAPVDEPVGDDVPAAPEDADRRLPGTDLHAHPGAAVRRSPDPGQLPRLARVRRRAQPRRTRSSRSAAPVSYACAGPRPASPSPRHRCDAPDRWTRTCSDRVAGMLNLDRTAIVDASWLVNGPPWIGVLLESAEAVLAVRPGVVDAEIGITGLYPAGFAGEHRSPRLLPGRGIHGRGSGDREPERRPGPVAARLRPPHRTVRRPPGHRPRTVGARAHHRQPTTRSGSAAAR